MNIMEEAFIRELENVEEYRKLNDIQRKFIRDTAHIYFDENRKKMPIPVIAAPCGIGKSTFIKILINFLVRHTEISDGLIVVTDYVKNLEDYVECNRDFVALITSETFNTEIRTEHKHKILLMTTKRFFSLTLKDLSYYMTWDGGERNNIIIDGKAEIFKHININIANLDRMHTAIDSIRDFYSEEKAWCISQFEIFLKNIRVLMDEYEKLCKNTFYMWHNKTIKLTDDYERFQNYINKHRGELLNNYSQFFMDLYAIKIIITKGSMFYCQKKSKDDNQYNDIEKKKENKYKYFSVIVDRTNLLLDILANIMIFDATADISPEYQFSLFHIIKDNKYDIDLSNVEIDVINVQTSKQKLENDSNKAKKNIGIICDIISSKGKGNNVAVFTYNSIEDDFLVCTKPCYLGHFGNLHGSNEYKDCRVLAHVGLNRQPHINYFILDSMVNPYNKLEEIKNLPQEKQIETFAEWLNAKGKITESDTFSYSLLADLEQNIMRSAIRNRKGEKVKILLFCDCRIFKKLIRLMRGRYEKLNATITEKQYSEFALSKALNRKGNTKTKDLLQWFQNLDDHKVFTVKELYAETGLDKIALNNVKRNVSIKELFEKMKTPKRGYYRFEKEYLGAII